MKNRNSVFLVVVLALAFVLAPFTKAAPSPGGGPTHPPPNNGVGDSVEGENLPAMSIHSAGNVLRGKTATFILEMKPALMFGGMYANFSVSGTAVAGVDYVPFLSPAYIGQSGYAVISFATLPNLRAGSAREAYSVVVKLEPGLGYALGEPKSATIWIKSAQ